MGYRGLSGQSAIEYLMTYGWMLLVVAVVGGAVFSLVQSEDIESVSGFTGSDVRVENFGLSQSGSLDFVLRNGGADEVVINSVEVVDEEGDSAYVYPSESLGVGSSSSVSVPNVVQTSGSNSLDLRVNYDMGGLSDLGVEGSVSGSVGVEPEVWESDVDGDGSIESAEFYGDGSSVSPYRVGSVEGLQMIGSESGSSFELGSDIDASGTGSWNGGIGFDPIDSFSGSLDGNDHTIDNLTINRSTSDIGLFSKNSGNLTNIVLNRINITGESRVGSLAGVNSGNINKVSASGEVSGDPNDYNHGGIVGKNNADGNVENSRNIANVSGNFVAGIVGYNFGSIYESYSAGEISGSTTGGVVATNDEGDITNSYWDDSTASTSDGGTSLSTSEMTGDSAVNNMDGFDFQNVWTTVDGDYPELR